MDFLRLTLIDIRLNHAGGWRSEMVDVDIDFGSFSQRFAGFFVRVNIYGPISKRRHCAGKFERGLAQGACFSVTKPADILVNVRRREFRLSAFRVSCLSCERLSRSAGPRGALVFEKDKPGSERNRGGCFRTLESRPETLGLSV